MPTFYFVVKIAVNNRNNPIIFSSIDQLSRNSILISLIRSLRLGNLLKHLYYKIYCPRSHIMKLTFMGLSAQFYADNFDELRALETTFSDKGKSEEKILNPLMKMIQPGDVAYDIGASIGMHTIFMAKKLKKTGKIISFEPENGAFKALRKNINLNRLNNVKLIQSALGDQVEVRVLYNQPKVGIGASSLLKFNGGKYKHQVDVIPGDDIVEKENLPLPCAVKIDVEGFEYPVIRGLKKTLSQKQCRLVCCEIHSKLYPETINSSNIFRLLHSYGFGYVKTQERGGEIHAIFYKNSLDADLD